MIFSGYHRNYFLVAENEIDLAGWMQCVSSAASMTNVPREDGEVCTCMRIDKYTYMRRGVEI